MEIRGELCPQKGRALAPTQLGDLDRDPQLDFGQDAIEARITRPFTKFGRRGLEAQQHRGVHVAHQQADLQFVQRVERDTASLETATTPLGRIIDALEGDQGVDPPDRPQARDRSRIALRLGVGQAEPTRSRTARDRRGAARVQVRC